MTAAVAEAILHEIHRDGFHVGERKPLDILTGEIDYHLDATELPSVLEFVVPCGCLDR